LGARATTSVKAPPRSIQNLQRFVDWVMKRFYGELIG